MADAYRTHYQAIALELNRGNSDAANDRRERTDERTDQLLMGAPRPELPVPDPQLPEPESPQPEPDLTEAAAKVVTSVTTGWWLGAPVTVLTLLLMVSAVDGCFDDSDPAFARQLKWDQKQLRINFAKEVRRWFPLNHPNVLKLYGACHRDEQVAFVVERVTGGNLRAYLKTHPDQTWNIMHQVALAVQYLHERGIVHLALSGSNTLVTANGSAKLVGIGFSSQLDGDDEKESIEQWKASEWLLGVQTRPESDVYSLGMCIVEAVAGKVPYAQELQEKQAVRSLILHAVFIQRSAQFSDRVWDLVTRMCTFSSRQRLKIGDAVRALEEVALEEARVRTPFPVHRIARYSGGGAEEQLELVFSLTSGGDIEPDDYEPDDLELEQRARARLNDLWRSTPSTGGELMEGAGERYRVILTRLIGVLERYKASRCSISRRFSERQSRRHVLAPQRHRLACSRAGRRRLGVQGDP